METAVVACLEYADTLPAAQRADTMADLEVVLELRGVVDKLRRRARELRALYETAGDLSAMREVEDVLQAIVRRGRQLLDTDIAYLMLVDESRRDTYMRVTEGTTRKGFGDIRLPLGVGLGGQVAQEGAPMWTRNYLGDERHAHVIDEIVDEEDVVAVLGVPLRLGRKILGVLFAADRSERDFSTDEVSLLASLADHAAIAIENASRFQKTQEALEELSRANSVIEQSNASLERAIDLHERLMRLVIGGGEPQDLAAELRDVLSGCIIVRDEHDAEIGRAIPGEITEDRVDRCLAELATVSLEAGTQRLDCDAMEAVMELVMTPIVAATSDRFGTLIYIGPPAGDDDLRSLQRGAASIALLLLNRRARDEADNRLRGEILAELLARSPQDVHGIRRRANLLDVDLSQPQVLLVLIPDGADGLDGGVTALLQGEAAGLARHAGGLVTSYADRVVILLPHSWAKRPAGEVAQRLQHLRVTVGAAGPSTNLSELADLEDRARRAARLLIALGRAGEGRSAEELGIFGLLLSDTGPDRIHAFIAHRLEPVWTYDTERGTSLLATMETYFAHEGNVGQTADALYIHVNTVYQRLDRLDRLLGPGWRSGDQALEIRWALRLHQLMGTPTEPTIP